MMVSVNPLILFGCFISTLPTAAVYAEREVDVELRLLALETPSAVDTTADLGALPGPICTVPLNESFVLELWTSDVGSVNTGVTGFFVDLSFDHAVLRADQLVHSPLFTLFPEGTIDNAAGRIIDFGGNNAQFQGQGIAPLWAKIGHVTLTVIGSGVADVVSSLGHAGIGVFGRLPPPPSQVLFGTVSVCESLACGDFDADGDVDLADFAVFQVCFDAGDCPGGADADFDDGDVDLDDYRLFYDRFCGPR